MASRRTVLIIALEEKALFDTVYAELLRALRAKGDVIREATTAETAIAQLESPGAVDSIAAVLIADPAVIQPCYANVAAKMVEYARDGGTLIFGGLCSSHGKPADLDNFFKLALSLPWKCGSCHRTTFRLNRSVAMHERFAHLPIHYWPKFYRMEALHIDGAGRESQLYVLTDISVIELDVLYPIPITNRSECPVLFADYGRRGIVAWIGDVNAQAASIAVVLAMCNL